MRLFLSILAFLLGIPLLIKKIKESKKVDTESIAEVTEVIPLGVVDLQKAYAIKYTIHSSDPFELIITPTSKKAKLGKEKTIYYEEARPKENFYFKTIGAIDRRLFYPICMIFFGVILMVAYFIK